MPKFIVHRTVNQTIAIEAADAEKADTDATTGKGEIIEHTTNQRVTSDTRPVPKTQSAQPGTPTTSTEGK